MGIPESHRDLVERALFAHFATSRPDGTVQVNPMWFAWDGERIRLTHTTGRQKYRNVTANPDVALSINDPDLPYRYLELRGRVTAIEPDPEAAFFMELADRYGLTLDGPPKDAPQRVVLVIEPTSTSQQ